jgi:hypothetical protein
MNQTFSLQPFRSADTQLLPHPILTDTPLLNKERGRGEVLINNQSGTGEVLINNQSGTGEVLINNQSGTGEVLNAAWYEPIPDFKITGNIARQANQFTIHYALLGDLKDVAIAAPSDAPARKHELWKDTCFEFFIGVKNSDRYWEFNLSPAEHWNVYRFDAYRQGMQEERAFETLPFDVECLLDGLAIALNINLDKIIPANQAIEIAITTVIKYKNGEVSYWALTHQGTEADFHRRDSFIIAS